MEMNVKRFGAAGNSIKTDTAAIQSAIDHCNDRGGGMVNIPSGIYIIGTLHLKSHVTLFLEHGAVLAGSDRIEDYPDNETCFVDAVGHTRGKALIYAYQAENIGICGEGMITGRGGQFGVEHPAHLIRPFLLRFAECRNIKLSGVHFSQSAAWCLHLQGCQNVIADGIHILNRCNENNDGIDIDSCEKVVLKNSYIDSGDDGICLKTTSQKPCKNIKVENCVVTTRWAAFKIGTESAGDFEDIEVKNCRFYDVEGCAVKVVPVDGGSVRRLNLKNLSMVNCTGPIFISTGRRLRSCYGTQNTTPGIIEGIHMEGIYGDVVGAKGGLYQGNIWGNAQGNLVLSGLKELPLKDIVIKDCHFSMPGGSEEKGEIPVPEMEKQYPEFHLFDPLPAWGAYLRYANQVTFDHVTFSKKWPDCRTMIAAEETEFQKNNIAEVEYESKR